MLVGGEALAVGEASASANGAVGAGRRGRSRRVSMSIATADGNGGCESGGGGERGRGDRDGGERPPVATRPAVGPCSGERDSTPLPAEAGRRRCKVEDEGVSAAPDGGVRLVPVACGDARRPHCCWSCGWRGGRSSNWPTPDSRGGERGGSGGGGGRGGGGGGGETLRADARTLEGKRGGEPALACCGGDARTGGSACNKDVGSAVSGGDARREAGGGDARRAACRSGEGDGASCGGDRALACAGRAAAAAESAGGGAECRVGLSCGAFA